MRRARKGRATLAAWALTACAGMLGADPADAQAAAQEIVRAGVQPSAAGPAEYFTGRVRVDPAWPANDEINASGGTVTFEAGARSAWHTHPRGQRLLVLSGVGLTQEWGKPVQVLRPGDVVWCPPGVKHWHGAATSTKMSHLAVTGSLNGRNVDWMEKVTDEQYRADALNAERTTMNADQRLSRKHQAIPPIAAAMAVGDMAQLGTALNEGLDEGLTISEAREVLVQLYAYAGFPRSLNALGELMKVLEARRQRGLKDAPGRDPGSLPTGKELLALGTANQTRLSGAPVHGPLFDFAPAIDEFLKTHLFGDIFGRDNLDWPSRELATVGALAALPGVESQLQSHVRIAMNVGLTAPQLRSAADVLAARGFREAAARIVSALDKPVANAPGR